MSPPPTHTHTHTHTLFFYSKILEDLSTNIELLFLLKSKLRQPLVNHIQPRPILPSVYKKKILKTAHSITSRILYLINFPLTCLHLASPFCIVGWKKEWSSLWCFFFLLFCFGVVVFFLFFFFFLYFFSNTLTTPIRPTNVSPSTGLIDGEFCNFDNHSVFFCVLFFCDEKSLPTFFSLLFFD